MSDHDEALRLANTTSEDLLKKHIENIVAPYCGAIKYSIADKIYQLCRDKFTGEDRKMLLHLMQRFDAETLECRFCGHSEDMATMDSADALRKYIAQTGAVVSGPTITTTPAPTEGATPEVVRTAPEKIWLQVSDDALYCEFPFPPIPDESLTWCQDSVLDCEVPYVRADIAELQRNELRERVEELEKDAARYCFLAEHCSNTSLDYLNFEFSDSRYGDKEFLDKAIDAAIAKEGTKP